MKISKIYIRNYDQFQDVELDFTNPNSNQPVERICFIGRNGTGKSKILKLINWFFHSLLGNLNNPRMNILIPGGINQKNTRFIFLILHREEYFFIFYFEGNVEILRSFNPNQESEFAQNLINEQDLPKIWEIISERRRIEGLRHRDFVTELMFKNNSGDSLIYSPDECGNNGYFNIKDVPVTNVSEALALSQNFPWFTQVSPDTVDLFWQLLVYNLKKRDDDRENFERASENLNKTKAQLIKEFDQLNPKILDELAVIWNKILEKAGLEFDAKGASNPIQLTDNLKAYIRLKSSKQKIPYSELSTGIRNFIFRIGHIRSVYFNRRIDRGFLLVDEAENGLFPDFLFELMETYNEIVLDRDKKNNTQMFFATHNPIIAAQFGPQERIILDWNEDGSVKVKRGYSPEGDDPNDLLSNDFELKDLMGLEGRRMWKEYQDLKKALIRENDKPKKEELIQKINQIGSLYNFS